jgi:hypothetical protein
MTQVFISYSHKDREFVTRLTADLRRQAAQLEVWYDMMVAPGESLARSLAERRESADIILSVLSPDYLESEWTQQEAEAVVSRASENKARFIPLLAKPCHPRGLIAQYPGIDFTGAYDDALKRLIRELTADPERSANCFIVMPFGDAQLQKVYEHFVKPAVEECQLNCVRGDDILGSKAIMEEVRRQIQRADIIVADLTHKNANVLYEVGLGHALDKPVLLLTQSIDDVPFDLRHLNVLLYQYTPDGCASLRKELKKHVLALL